MILDLSEPGTTETAFYSAFSALDLETMRGIWAPLSTIYCVHPGGPALQGTEAVIRSWREIFASAKPPGISYRLIDAHHTSSLAVHLVEESIKPSGGSGEEASLVMATNVFLRHQGKWHLLAHHASLPLMKAGRKRVPRLH